MGNVMLVKQITQPIVWFSVSYYMIMAKEGNLCENLIKFLMYIDENNGMHMKLI